MSTSIKCSFCNQSFDFDNSSGSLLATCPHCGKQNSVAVHPSTTQRLHILRNAPSLLGGKPCPECAALIDQDAMLCVHCGYNLATGKKMESAHASLLGRKSLVRLCKVILLGMIAFGAYLLSPQFKKLLPPIVSSIGTGMTGAVETNTETSADFAPQPTIITDEVPEDKFSAVQAEAPRLAFEAKKAKAEEGFRSRLNTSSPLYKIGDKTELRAKNGQLIRGTLLRSEGEGSNIVFVIAAMAGEVRVLPSTLDHASRIRIDPEHREKYIQHMLNSRPSTPQTNFPATK